MTVPTLKIALHDSYVVVTLIARSALMYCSSPLYVTSDEFLLFSQTLELKSADTWHAVEESR